MTRLHHRCSGLAALIAALCLCLVPGLSALPAAQTKASPEKSRPPKPAKLKISGYGFFGNRELKRMLVTLELSGNKPPLFGASFVEDASLILLSRIQRDGFLHPDIQVTCRLQDGSRLTRDASTLVDSPLPRPLRIKMVHFKIRKGTLYYFTNLEFVGLHAMTDKQAQSYFIERGTLIHLKRNSIYTPQRLRQGLSSISEFLNRQGLQDAKVEATDVVIDNKTGAVRVRVKVNQGPKYMVRSVKEELFHEAGSEPVRTKLVFTNQPYSHIWVQDFSLGLKTNQFARGYPDTTVDIKELDRTPATGLITLDLAAQIHTGAKVWVGAVEFQGQKRTKQSLMSRRVRIKKGDLLNPIRAEEGRYRLASLGIFNTVDLDYQPRSEHVRDVLYTVTEGKRLDVSLLFGYGSYELLRGGVEAQLYNLWGRAHSARLKAVQSFKMTSGEFTYTIPELLGKDVDLFFHGFGLRREEVSFTREEYGGGFGAHKFFKNYATDLSARYNYQILNAVSIFPALASEGLVAPAVGSVLLDVRHDRRDNPLYPRSGYKIFSTLETASEYLAGDANYERVEVMPSFHTHLGREGTFLSLGVSHGAAVSFGSAVHNLPFNKRFFPGGANSIRGYQEGEASPRDRFGNYVGAATYLLGTVEIEQLLTPKWSLVVFSDSLGFAHSLDHYPFDTGLFSVGGGIRWKTIIGPVRLEYGHNLNPRPGDPSGTIHFSLGFPF